MKPTEILKDVIRHPFAWPGGYEKVLVMDDGGIVCWKCAAREYHNILHSTRGNYKDGWQVIGVDLLEHCEGEVYCEHCGDLLNPE